MPKKGGYVPLHPPTQDEIGGIAEGYGLSLGDGDLESFQGLMRGTLESYARLDELTEPTLPVRVRPAFARSPKTIRSTPGVGKWKSRVCRQGRLQEKRRRLKTMSA